MIAAHEPAANSSTSAVLVRAGSRVVLSCRSPNANPKPFITWFKDGYPLLQSSSAEEETQNVSHVAAATGDRGGFDSISYLSYVATSSDHLKEIRCDVKMPELPRIMHASIPLEVKFAPEIIRQPASVLEAVENGPTFSLNVSARANPPPTYTCSSSNNKKYTLVNATLNFNATRSDNGHFICSIANTETPHTDVTFKLNVKCKE